MSIFRIFETAWAVQSKSLKFWRSNDGYYAYNMNRYFCTHTHTGAHIHMHLDGLDISQGKKKQKSKHQ